jgi:UDP-2,3-diacylglucosamine hydrolase
MPQESRLIVISDLHLWGNTDPMYRALLRFMDEAVHPGDKLFIVGDLFDLFVGSKKVFESRFQDLLQRLLDAGKKGIEIFYLEGNHDFHLESLFDDYPHIRMYADTLHYETWGKKLHFCHGDRVNWRDFGYQAFRFATRNLFFQCLIDAAPGTLIDGIGRGMANASRGYHVDANERVVSFFRNHACEIISSGYDFVIMGHSHYFDDMRFRVGNHEGQYINCGYPRKHLKYFMLEKNDSFFKTCSFTDYISTSPTRP